MDVVSHFLIPYAAALFLLGLARGGVREAARQDPALRRAWEHRMALAVVFGAGAVAPDLDGFYGWLRHSGELYFLQHRGFSHSFLGVALHGVLAAGLVHLASRLFRRRLGWLHWRAAYLPVAVVGGFTHLAMDGATFMGVPLFWPMSDARYTLNVYPWLLLWMLPVSLALLGLQLLKRIDERRLVQLATVFVVLVVIAGGARLGARPDLLPEETAFPRRSHQEWIVLTPAPDPDEGWIVQLHRSGAAFGAEWRNATSIAPGSEAAVARAVETNAYRGLRLGTMGPIVTQTRALEDGGWEVNFTAIVPRYDAVYDARWTPANPIGSWGLLSLRVDSAASDWSVERKGW